MFMKIDSISCEKGKKGIMKNMKTLNFLSVYSQKTGTILIKLRNYSLEEEN